MITAQATHAWSADLDHSRELKQIEKIGFDMLLSWFESWRASMQIEPGSGAVERFWKAQVKQKPREKWQLGALLEQVENLFYMGCFALFAVPGTV